MLLRVTLLYSKCLLYITRCDKLRNGSIQDIWVVLLVVISLAVIVPITWTVIDSFQGQLNEFENTTMDERYNATGAAEHTGSEAKSALSTFDRLIGFLFVGIGLVAIAFAVYLPSHSIYALFSWLIVGFQAFVSIVFENFYAAFMATDAMADAGAAMTVSSVIMENMLELTIVFGCLVLIAQYATGRGGVPVR